jgi:hypothetical protein
MESEPELQAKAREALIKASEVDPGTSGTYIDRWRYEVTDPGLLPREYLCPDEKRIAAIVKEQGCATAIPGVRVWNDPVCRPGGAK